MLAYAPMSNGQAERMVGTVKKTVGRLMALSEMRCEGKMNMEIYGYRLHPVEIGLSPYEFMYGVPLRLVSSGEAVGYDTLIEGRMLENYRLLLFGLSPRLHL